MPQFWSFLPPIYFLLISTTHLGNLKVLAQMRLKRERAAFDLLRLEQELEEEIATSRILKDQPRVEEEEKGEEDEVEECRDKCNQQLRMGLDMVKAHSAFGSIGVPSVIEQSDLQLFCRLDVAHDKCLIGCGYQVEFNMRDFVCKWRREELISHLDCFVSSAPKLKRQCGSGRCGPYSELEMSLVGVGLRCRTLLCDLSCTQQVLASEPKCHDYAAAGQYLHAYSRLQVSSWLRQILGPNAISDKWPRSCAKLICGNGTRDLKGGNNCTLPEIST